jgi:hypothetical protein
LAITDEHDRHIQFSRAREAPHSAATSTPPRFISSPTFLCDDVRTRIAHVFVSTLGVQQIAAESRPRSSPRSVTPMEEADVMAVRIGPARRSYDGVSATRIVDARPAEVRPWSPDHGALRRSP